MWLMFVILLFIFTIGMTVGGLLAAPRIPPRPFQLILFGFVFSFLGYIGMISGMFMSGLIGFRFMEISLAIITLLFIVAAVSRFHPTLGFFHSEDKVILTLLAVLFFLMGMEWGILEWRAFFSLLASSFFSVALFFGLFVQQQIRSALWWYSYISFVPLIWLLLVTILKLL